MVTRCGNLNQAEISALLKKYSLCLETVADGVDIAGSFWGNPEAGLIGNHILVRSDTPVHSMLHEACHYICMDELRRRQLHTDAAGDYDEENAVCYLQILLADQLKGTGRAALMSDMDAWGYSFRLGSTRRWFEQDAEDARAWLQSYDLIDNDNNPTWKLRK